MKSPGDVAKIVLQTVEEETDGFGVIVIVSDGETAVAGSTRLSTKDVRLLLEETFKKSFEPSLSEEEVEE